MPIISELLAYMYVSASIIPYHSQNNSLKPLDFEVGNNFGNEIDFVFMAYSDKINNSNLTNNCLETHTSIFF